MLLEIALGAVLQQVIYNVIVIKTAVIVNNFTVILLVANHINPVQDLECPEKRSAGKR
jgi:hypothetical protein